MKLTGILLTFILIATSCNNTNTPKFKSNDDALSYYLGVYTGLKLKEAGYTKFDQDVFDQAIKEVFKQKNPAKDNYRKADLILYKYLSTGIERKYAKTLEEGRKFLASNKTRPEVKTTSDGIQYEVVKEGTGSIPNDNDSVIARFIGYTLDGKVFISSENYAQPFKILQAIPGCRKALHLMKEGSRYKIYLPTELAYARNPIPGNILKPNMAVMFDIILIHIVSKDPDFIENRNNIKK